MAEGWNEGFASLTYFDPALGLQAMKLLPGEYHATATDLAQITVLGSCVAACIRDVGSGIGGMNHFMLPDGPAERAEHFDRAARYGVFAMEVLINSLLKLGARRSSLEAKVFGGGKMMNTTVKQTDVGRRNAGFVLEYLGNEKIPVVAQDLQGNHARKVYFFPKSGKVRVKKLMDLHDRKLQERESDYKSRLSEPRKASGGEIELFE